MVVYLSENIDTGALQKLKEHATVVDTFENIEDIDAIIVRRVKVTRELIGRAKRLKVIGMHGIGPDTIDLIAAKEYGVPVINVPTANVESVAELAIGFIFDLYRKISLANYNIRLGKYQRFAPVELMGSELSGKTLGLVGVGHVSQRIAEILRVAFHCRVLGYDPYCSAENFEKNQIQRVDNLPGLIAGSDIVNVSVPSTPSTRNMVGAKEFSRFKKGGILVSTSHGGVIDEQALYEALRKKQLAGAAVDVFRQDPPAKDDPLLTLENLVATPHIGGNTHECLERVGNRIVSGVLGFLKEGKDITGDCRVIVPKPDAPV